MTETIYQNLVRSVDSSAPESIHLCDYPSADEEMINKELEENMDDVLQVVVLGRSCRNATNIKTRQPIAKMYVSAAFALGDFYTEIIEDELNVKSVEWSTDVSEYTEYTLKPQLKILGPKFGKSIGKLKAILENLDGNDAVSQINETGFLTIAFDGEEIKLEKEDILIGMKQKEGFVAESENGIIVVFDTTLTPELIEEGYFRELVSKLQTMRKDAGFEVMDRINVYIQAGGIKDALVKYENKIREIVLADNIFFDRSSENGVFEKEWDINGNNVILAVEKI